MAKKSVGAAVPATDKKLTPESVYGLPWSLNYEATHWVELPSRRITLNHANPTIVPRKGEIADVDVQCIIRMIESGKLVPGPTPRPALPRNPDRLAHHREYLRPSIPFEAFREHIASIINGSNTDGGYTKLQLLEFLLAEEKHDSIRNIRGPNRPLFLKEMEDAIAYVHSYYGPETLDVISEPYGSVPLGGATASGARPLMPGSANGGDPAKSADQAKSFLES